MPDNFDVHANDREDGYNLLDTPRESCSKLRRSCHELMRICAYRRANKKLLLGDGTEKNSANLIRSTEYRLITSSPATHCICDSTYWSIVHYTISLSFQFEYEQRYRCYIMVAIWCACTRRRHRKVARGARRIAETRTIPIGAVERPWSCGLELPTLSISQCTSVGE